MSRRIVEGLEEIEKARPPEISAAVKFVLERVDVYARTMMGDGDGRTFDWFLIRNALQILIETVQSKPCPKCSTVCIEGIQLKDRGTE